VRSILREIYNHITCPINEKWIGSLQAAAVVRSLQLNHNFKRYLPSIDQTITVLDAGCGNGAPQTIILARRYPKTQFTAVDYYNTKPSSYKLPIPENISFVQSDLFCYQCPICPFHLIICMDVLEHLDDDQKMIGIFNKWLAQKGLLLLHVPKIVDKSYFKYIPPKRKGDDSRPHAGDCHKREGYTLTSLRTILENNGFKIIENRYTFSSRTWMFKQIYQFLDNYGVMGIGLIMLPFIYFNTIIDIYTKLRKGRGIFVIAQKTDFTHNKTISSFSDNNIK